MRFCLEYVGRAENISKEQEWLLHQATSLEATLIQHQNNIKKTMWRTYWCFWENVCEMSALLQSNFGCDTLCSFLQYKTSWACLVASGLKVIFHWNAQLLILFKSSLSYFPEALILCVPQRKEMCRQANSLM